MRRGICATCRNPVVGFLTLVPGVRLAFVPSQNSPEPAALPAPDRHIFHHRRVAEISYSVPKLFQRLLAKRSPYHWHGAWKTPRTQKRRPEGRRERYWTPCATSSSTPTPPPTTRSRSSWRSPAPDVRVLGLTTVAGNVGLEQATQNALLTAEICNSDVPVFAGADKPLTRAHDHAHWFHGKDGLGDRGYPAPKRRPEREHARRRDPAPRASRARPHAGDARAARPMSRWRSSAIPTLAERIGRCVVMGGAPCCEGNVTPAAEYNIWVDPEAARAVFRSKLNDRDGRLARLARRVRAERRRDRGDRGARHGEGASSPSSSNSTRPRGLSRPDRRDRPLARRSDRDGGRARPLDRPLVVAPSGRDRDAGASSPAA